MRPREKATVQINLDNRILSSRARKIRYDSRVPITYHGKKEHSTCGQRDAHLEGDIVVEEASHEPLEHESVELFKRRICQSSEDILEKSKVHTGSDHGSTERTSTTFSRHRVSHKHTYSDQARNYSLDCSSATVTLD